MDHTTTPGKWWTSEERLFNESVPWNQADKVIYWMFFACLNLLDAGPVPVDGSWGSWKGWSKCSQSCGGGTMYRVRNCDSPHTARGGEYCKGKPIEVKPCENQCKLNWYFNPSFYNFFLVFSCRPHWWFLGILEKMVPVFPELWWRNWDQAETLWQSSPGPGGDRLSGGSTSGETVQHWDLSWQSQR